MYNASIEPEGTGYRVDVRVRAGDVRFYESYEYCQDNPNEVSIFSAWSCCEREAHGLVAGFIAQRELPGFSVA